MSIIALLATHGIVPQCSICGQVTYLTDEDGGGITICLDRKHYIATEPREIAVILCTNCATNLQASIAAQLQKIDKRIELLRRERRV